MESLVCPACGQLNRSESRFCQSCGAALVKTCPQCSIHNRLLARFCISCGAHLGVPLAMPIETVGSLATPARAISAAVLPSALLRVLEANTYAGFGRSQDRSPGQSAGPFNIIETAFHIRLRLLNLDPNRQHSHRLFAQFFRPNGRLHFSRERRELVVAPAGRTEVETSIFGLRIAGTEVVNYPGVWRAVVYLDEDKLVEMPFEIVGN